jgi:hypothetical protein
MHAFCKNMNILYFTILAIMLEFFKIISCIYEVLYHHILGTKSKLSKCCNFSYYSFLCDLM